MPDAKAVLESWIAAFEAKDVTKILDFLADDVSVETESVRGPITGKQMLRDILAPAMNSYESIRVDRKKLVSSGRDAAALVNVHVEFGADIDIMGEKLSTAGKGLDVQSAIFVEINEAGKIARVMRVRDTWAVIAQLGLSPDRVKALVQKFEASMKEPRARAA